MHYCIPVRCAYEPRITMSQLTHTHTHTLPIEPFVNRIIFSICIGNFPPLLIFTKIRMRRDGPTGRCRSHDEIHFDPMLDSKFFFFKFRIEFQNNSGDKINKKATRNTHAVLFSGASYFFSAQLFTSTRIYSGWSQSKRLANWKKSAPNKLRQTNMKENWEREWKKVTKVIALHILHLCVEYRCEAATYTCGATSGQWTQPTLYDHVTHLTKI